MASKKSQKMRITLKAYDHQLIDFAAAKLIETVKKTGAKVSGPVPLPTKKEVVTILRAVHKYKDSREQFEQRTHKRLIDVLTPSQKTVDALSRLEMPAGEDRGQPPPSGVHQDRMGKGVSPWVRSAVFPVWG